MQKFSEEFIKKAVGKIIQALKISQESLAEKLDINIRTMSNIENGHTFISAKTLSKLCEVFNLSPKTFFDIATDVNDNNIKLNEITDKLLTGGQKKIDFYYDLINLVDNKDNG